MRHRFPVLLGALAFSWGVAALSAARPCTMKSPACLQQVPLGASGHYSLVYSTYPLGEPNPAIRRALIVIHGVNRNADDYFLSGAAAAFVGGRLEDTIVMAPRFAVAGDAACQDRLAEGEISWSCSDSWMAGGRAKLESEITSFALIDTLLKRLADRTLFPNLASVVVAGHSAGGQFVARYAAASAAPASMPFPVHLVVANPSSYLYFTADRLPVGAECAANGTCTADFAPYPGRDSCPGFDSWRYGLERREGPLALLAPADLRQRYANASVTYLLGEWDNLQDRYLDQSCAAMAQGPNRLVRGLNYWNYATKLLGARHKLVIVPSCGHNNRCMFTSDEAMPVLFPPLPQ